MIPRYTRPGNGGDLVARDTFSHLVRDRGACRRRHGRARDHSQGRGGENLGQGQGRQVRRARIEEIERETKHDVVAFLTHLAEIVGPEARFVHQGMTSSDVLDTCLDVQLVRAADLLIGMLKSSTPRWSAVPANSSSPRPSAAPTAFMPNPPRSDLNSPSPMRNSTAPRAASKRRAKRSRPARSRAR